MLLWYTWMVFVVDGERGVLKTSVGWVFLTSLGSLCVEYFDFTNKMGYFFYPINMESGCSIILEFSPWQSIMVLSKGLSRGPHKCSGRLTMKQRINKLHA